MGDHSSLVLEAFPFLVVEDHPSLVLEAFPFLAVEDHPFLVLEAFQYSVCSCPLNEEASLAPVERLSCLPVAEVLAGAVR